MIERVLPAHTPSLKLTEQLSKGSTRLNLDNLHALVRYTAAEGADLDRHTADIAAAYDHATDEVLGNIAVQVRKRIEETTLELKWILHRTDAAIFNRLVERREGDETAKVAMPHELADIELVPEFSPYSFDVDQLETILPLLKEDERAKLLKIEPEREAPLLSLSEVQRNAIVGAINLISAHVPHSAYHPNILETLQSMLETQTVPRRITAGATVSINVIAKKYAGSNVETLIKNATNRDKVRDKLTIAPRASTEPKNVSVTK